MQTTRGLGVALGLAVLACTAQAARLALVVGNDQYTQIRNLSNAVNDAELMARTLGRAGFQVALRRNLGRQALYDEIDALQGRLNAGDEVVFFFAGHGVQVGSDPVLLPADIRADSENKVLREGVPLLYVQRALRGARLALMVVDACRDNPLPREGTRTIGEARGLKAPDVAKGQVVIMSAGPGQQALDRVPGQPGVRNGLFTWLFSQVVVTPGLDVLSALRQVRDQVEDRALSINHAQRPSLVDDLRGQFALVAGLAPPPPPSPRPDPAPNPAPGPMAGQVRKDCSDCPDMVLVGKGEFTMGSPSNEAGRDADEGPLRGVRVAAYWLGRTEVTVGQYQQCVQAGGCAPPEWDEPGSKFNVRSGTENHYRRLGSALTAADHPVVGVSWNDAQRYVRWLSQSTGQGYRLPSEAEWEYAARAGGDGRYSFGDDDGRLGEYAWFGDNSASHPHAVGTGKANGWGLYDLHGNVWEWVQDCYVDSYRSAPVDGFAVASSNCAQRVLRGGAWYNNPQGMRAAYRYRNAPDIRNDYSGFRVARTF